MKFTQLPIGARFLYQGRLYSKTGPLAACADDGGQRMIPRSAVVRPAGEQHAEPPARDLHEVLADYHAHCKALLVEVAETGTAGLAAASARLDAAYGELRKAID
jgi:hypothetical protein